MNLIQICFIQWVQFGTTAVQSFWIPNYTHKTGTAREMQNTASNNQFQKIATLLVSR